MTANVNNQKALEIAQLKTELAKASPEEKKQIEERLKKLQEELQASRSGQQNSEINNSKNSQAVPPNTNDPGLNKVEEAKGLIASVNQPVLIGSGTLPSNAIKTPTNDVLRCTENINSLMKAVSLLEEAKQFLSSVYQSVAEGLRIRAMGGIQDNKTAAEGWSKSVAANKSFDEKEMKNANPAT